jgi:flagellar basal-body rod protein FlgC
MTMDYQQSFAISAAGMGVERLRVEVAALNLANAHAVVGGDGPGYQALRVSIRGPSQGTSVFDFGAMIQQGLGAPSATVDAVATPARRVYEPGHPFADTRGFVIYPGVDAASEMVTMMSAVRAYEANVAAMNAARTLALKTLDIGGSS